VMPVLSLRVRMLLLVLLAVVPALGLILYSGLDARYQEGARAQEQALQLVQHISHDQEQAIKETRQLLITLAQLPAVRERDAEACSRILGGISRLHVRYANLGAIRPDGSVFCSAVRVSASPNARDSGWFQQVLRTRNFSVSQFHFGGITGRAVLTMAYPVLGSDSEMAAAVFASLDLAWLNRYLSESLLPPGSVLSVIDRRGTVLARYPDPEFWVGENIADTPLAQEILAHQRAAVTEARGMDSVPRLYAYTPLAPALTQGVYVTIGIPSAVAYAEPERVLRRNLLGLGLAALLAIAAAWWGGAFLLRRAQPLLAAAHRLATGDLAARSGIDYGADEIGQVARSFDHMAEALHARDQALRESQAKLEKAQEVAHIGSWVSTPTPVGGQLTWSRETCRIFGLTEDRFDNRIETFFARVHPEDLEAVKEANRAALAGDKPYDIEHRIVRPDGSVRWVHEQADIVRDTEGKAISMIGVIQDITERKTSEERIQYLAYYDALTGLPNRALFMDRLQHAVIDADRRERLVGVMFLDVDRFKDVNDSLGHETGDQLLKAVAERLTAAVRKGDTVARLGGDEFTIVLAGMAHVDDAAHVAQKILEVFEQPFHVAQREFHMTASLGITLYPFDDSNFSHLLRNADIAMYRAKEAGRNTYQFYTAEMTAKASERLALKNDLQRAFKQHEFSLVYQPIVSLQENRILGIEALLRWRHPERGLIAPDQFIGLTEETGLIVTLGEWVLRAAC
ncbi:MAG: diguanylate cyclase, partial [Gammaproteobacteria bacterium]|nr:diguanylate cyclase [Gammaproteobacteria bacterium]